MISIANLEGMIYTAILVLFRTSSLLLTAPLIGTSMVPARIRLLLCILITIVMLPSLLVNKLQPDYSLQLIFTIANEVFIGIVLGFAFQMVFQIFIVVGDMLSMQMGLSFAMMIDPASKINVPIVSQIYSMMVSLIFFILDGHLFFIQTLGESFQILPLTQAIAIQSFQEISMMGGWIIVHALQIALPLCIALLLVTTSLGVVARSVPQLNVFTLGMPLSVLLGLVLIWINIKDIPFHYANISREFSAATIELLYTGNKYVK